MAIVRFRADEIPPLTEEEKAELRALAEMPDDKIDYSDILEITDFSYRFATKRVRIGMKAAGTAVRKLLKIRALLVFSTTYAFFAFNLLNAIWCQAS